MGRRPKPTADKKARGNPGKRPLNKAEPTYSVGTSCPRWLPPDAKAEWKRVYPELTAAKVLTKVDRSTLVSYCLAWAEVKHLTEFLAKQQRMVVKTASTVKPFPEVAMRNAAIQTMLKCATALGMTPSARSTIKGEGGQETDPLEELLRRQRESGQPPNLTLVK
jgi:P27 family predicted phage terminase small subunit